MATLRVVRLVTGILVVLVGLVWLFQGVGVLPGSFMTGSTFWALVGAAAIVFGGWLIASARRRTR